MNVNPEPIVLNTNHLTAPNITNSPWDNRTAAYQMYDTPGIPKCTIAVTAYNRLDQTKHCIACILQYTTDVEYELLLIDNGSSDGTLDFFQSVAHGRKKIVRVTKNIGFAYAWHVAKNCFSGKYLVIVANDVYVTKNWLSNLLRCYESDPRIGFVEPVSSHVSNFQQVNLPYQDMEDMQIKAAAYNQSDPLKWDERLRCISLIGLYSRQVLDIVGLSDAAFMHAFIEDDLAKRLRYNGYKLMLCRDTWVCHDHDRSLLSEEQVKADEVISAYGRSVYREKYHGIDAWEDVLNFEFNLLHPFATYPFGAEALKVLLIDSRCGTPALEIRNHLHWRGLPRPEIYAFTTQAKYYADLQAVTDDVRCDRIAFLQDHYQEASFDVAVLCEPSGVQAQPPEVTQVMQRLLKNKGLLLYKMREEDGGEEHIVQVINEVQVIKDEPHASSGEENVSEAEEGQDEAENNLREENISNEAENNQKEENISNEAEDGLKAENVSNEAEDDGLKEEDGAKQE